MWLHNLGNLYQSSFSRTQDLADIANAISARERAIQLTPNDHPFLPRWFSSLGISLRSRFDRTGDVTHLTEAILAQQRAVQLTPDGHESLPKWLNSLGISFQTRFDRTGDLADIAEAISAQQRASELTSENSADLPVPFNSLGNSYHSRFHRTGDFADIAKAISAHQRAIQLKPENSADLPMRLNNLGISLQSRFDRAVDFADIVNAISAQQRAVQLTPQGDISLPSRLINLGSSHQSRFGRTGDLADIAEAIAVQERAVQLTPESHTDLPIWLDNLGVSYQTRFDHTGDLADIDEAISKQLRAVELLPAGHENLPRSLHNLGNSYHSRFSHSGSLSDIDEAISVQRRGIQLTPHDHAELPTQLSALGISYQSRYDRTGDIADITEAISVQRRAVELTPNSHADLPIWLNNLAISFQSRFDRAGDPQDLKAALSRVQSAATGSSGAPQDRLKASRHWARTSNLHTPLSPEVLTAFETAINLLALVAGLEQTVKGRYTQIQESAGIALDGAAAACRLQQPEKAVEWLEQGRCLVWNQLNNLRTPLDDLRTHHPQIAERLADTSRRLERASSTQDSLHASMDMATKISLQDKARLHLDLAREWDRLLLTVRNIPGFESFLQPPTCATILQHLPESGPIVIVNVNKDRCDAIALLPGQKTPFHIPLSNFSLEKANEYRLSLSAELEAKRVRVREAIVDRDDGLFGRGFKQRPMGQSQKPHSRTAARSVLESLWIEVAKPIIQELGYSKYEESPSGTLPRIWWCPTGAMSFLPIHAAGIYSDNGVSDSVSDYAASSYTPSITAVTDRVKSNRPIEKAVSGLFVTCQPSVKGACPIPGTIKEIQDVYAKATAHGVRVSRSDGSELTVPGLLERLKDYSSVHLACHASQNAADPLQSRFLLHKGDLDLGTIIQMNLENADLAFLSACETSTGEEKLSDEAVHLAAGMLAAGYRRVVATMWSIRDEYAPDVASDFYEYLWTHGANGNGFDGSLAAYALHYAIRCLRQRLDNSEESLLTWVPYVHFGY